MKTITELFSPQGRIARIQYWYVMAICSAILFLMQHFISIVPLLIILSLPIAWVIIVTSIKRWHDLDRSGWYCLLSLIPLVGPLIVLYFLGFKIGTHGKNRFGAQKYIQSSTEST